MTLTIPAAVPVFPLSMFGPVHLGIDENGEQVHVNLGERNMLLGGEPGGGKSNALNRTARSPTTASSSWSTASRSSSDPGATAPTVSSVRPSPTPSPAASGCNSS